MVKKNYDRDSKATLRLTLTAISSLRFFETVGGTYNRSSKGVEATEIRDSASVVRDIKG